MAHSFKFDRTAAIKAAWDLCWKSNLEQRAKGGYRPSTTYYLTASDIENQVRTFAEETAAGEAWGTRGRAWGRGYSTRIRFPGDLKGDVRNWLRNEERAGRLAGHNFGRGHISGKRYRPAGEPISESEKTTLEVKAARKDKPRPIHMNKKTGEYSSTFMCAPAKKRVSWSRSRSQAHVTMDASRVTCPRCLKLMEAK